MTQEELMILASGDNDQRLVTLDSIVSSGDTSSVPLLTSLLNDEIKYGTNKVYVVQDDRVTNALTGTPEKLPADAQDAINNNRMRSQLDTAMAALNLVSTDAAIRLHAAQTLRQSESYAPALDLVKKAEQIEQDANIRALLVKIRSGIELTSTDRLLRIKAATELASSTSNEIKQLLASRMEGDGESDPEVRKVIAASIRAIESRLSYYEVAGTIFTGLSLGSVLLLAALGLAITYGLMGVINMAHGEMMMLGAYATYVVQNLFRQYIPDWFDAYVLVAIPVAFFVTALIGIAMERSVIRHLYGRPLETLLATWGISLILMQLVRTLFGAQNVQVENPGWMSGGIEMASNLVLPYNRITIILFSLAVLLLIWTLLNKTRLGLFVRAVTQNRTMAGCVGVNTARVDAWAFGLGSGIAGLAGVALAQIGNVGPDLGKTYIVDSFMVVVVGGVGQLAGTVYAALGLGVTSKFLEGFSGAVLAKIIVLVIIIIFIQKRPQGIFALKGRSVD
ncbi:MAG: urea ABC transporter permease subunit UrtB [Gallionella sp.]